MDPLLVQILADLREDIQRVEEKVSDLNIWRAKVIAGSIVLSAIASGVTTMVLHFIAK